jgi:tetratricopeptide (TPR) repeat protein
VLEPIYTLLGRHPALERMSELFATYLSRRTRAHRRLRKVAELRIAAGRDEGGTGSAGAGGSAGGGEGELPELLDLVEAHVEQHKAQRDLIDLYREVCDQILDTRVQERVLLTDRQGGLCLGDRDVARDYYRRVLDNFRSPGGARSPGEDLRRRSQRAGVAAGDLLAAGDAGAAEDRKDDGQRRQYLMLAADLCERELGRADEAIALLEQVLQLFPSDPESATRSSGCTKTAVRWADLADLLERRLKYASSGLRDGGPAHRLGVLFEEELQQSRARRRELSPRAQCRQRARAVDWRPGALPRRCRSAGDGGLGAQADLSRSAARGRA